MDKRPLPTTAMRDGWVFLTNWTNKTKLTPYDWEAILAEANEIWETSGRDVLVRDVMCAYLEEIDRRFKEDGDN